MTTQNNTKERRLDLQGIGVEETFTGDASM